MALGRHSGYDAGGFGLHLRSECRTCSASHLLRSCWLPRLSSPPNHSPPPTLPCRRESPALRGGVQRIHLRLWRSCRQSTFLLEGDESWHFPRIAVGGGKWEELPGGPRLQGLNLATVGGKVYRVGGMEARNQAGEKQDLHSVSKWPSSTRMPTSGRPEWLYRTVDRPTMSLASAPSSWSWADGRCEGAKNPSGPIRLFYSIRHLQPRSGRPFLSPSSGEPSRPRLSVRRFMSLAD